MQSKATNVDEYLDELAPERRQCIAEVRALCQKILKGYEEGMQYGMPVFSKNGVGEVAFASQKNYVALYIMKKDVVDSHRDQLAGLSVGKGCIRFTKPEKVDFAVVESLLRATAKSTESAC